MIKEEGEEEEEYTIEFGNKYLLYTTYMNHKKEKFVFVRRGLPASPVVKIFLTTERTHSSDRFLSSSGGVDPILPSKKKSQGPQATTA